MSASDPFREGPDAARARKRRSLAIALGLVAFALIVFLVTAVRLTQNIAASRADNRALDQRVARG